MIVLDHKRSNAVNILLKKLPPTQSIKNAIVNMDSSVLTREGIDKLLAMLPTKDEILKIQEAQVSHIVLIFYNKKDCKIKSKLTNSYN